MFMCLVCTHLFKYRARATHRNKSAQHFPTLKIDFYFLYTECGGLVCVSRARHTNTHTDH